MLLFIARPRIIVLGNINGTRIYRNIDQYPHAKNVPGVLILQIDSPIYFANANYLRERYLIISKEPSVWNYMIRVYSSEQQDIYNSYFQDLEVDL